MEHALGGYVFLAKGKELHSSPMSIVKEAKLIGQTEIHTMDDSEETRPALVRSVTRCPYL